MAILTLCGVDAIGDRQIGSMAAFCRTVPPTRMFRSFENFVPTPHSVVTAHLIDKEGETTMQATEEIIASFRQRLMAVD